MKFDAETANVSDKIALIGELEHIRRHALRSAHLSIGTEDESFYLSIARDAQSLRRDFMNQQIGASEKLHCLGKSTASLRQIAYEIAEDDDGFLNRIDSLTDSVWERITGKDLSGCESCRTDKK